MDTKLLTDIDQSILLDNDCWLLILEYISDTRTLLAISRTCKQIYYIYKANEDGLLILANNVLKYTGVSIYMGNKFIKHGIEDSSKYTVNHISVNITYYNKGTECDKYPTNNDKKIYKYDDGLLRRVINIVDSKLHGEFIRMSESHSFYNIIYFDNGIWKYYIIYNVLLRKAIINNGKTKYKFSVIDTNSADVIKINHNNELVDILHGDSYSGNIYNIKLYNIWINIEFKKICCYYNNKSILLTT